MPSSPSPTTWVFPSPATKNARTTLHERKVLVVLISGLFAFAVVLILLYDLSASSFTVNAGRRRVAEMHSRCGSKTFGLDGGLFIHRSEFVTEEYTHLVATRLAIIQNLTLRRRGLVRGFCMVRMTRWLVRMSRLQWQSCPNAIAGICWTAHFGTHDLSAVASINSIGSVLKPWSCGSR